MNEKGLLSARIENLLSKAPFSNEFKMRKRKIDLVDMAYCDMRLYGSKLTREGVKSVLDGETIYDVPLVEHRIVYFHKKLMSDFEDSLHMQLDADARLAARFVSTLAGGGGPDYRHERVELYHLGYVPADPRGLKEYLGGVLRRAAAPGSDSDAVDTAAALHMAVIEAYPFDEVYSELAARAVMQYELVKRNLFPVDLGLSDQQYFDITGRCLRSGDAGKFAAAVRSALILKTDRLIELADNL
ncbi:MAG: hypothetical protein LBK04_04970 [Clostridiales Family XIII bacterium]|nr:hypothetical protein [Clostridiales Family XIII bacterium]